MRDRRVTVIVAAKWVAILFTTALAVGASASTAEAQPVGGPDAVLLRDGSELRGQILEADPSRGVSIRLADGTTRWVPAQQVSDVRRSAWVAPPVRQQPVQQQPVQQQPVQQQPVQQQPVQQPPVQPQPQQTAAPANDWPQPQTATAPPPPADAWGQAIASGIVTSGDQTREQALEARATEDQVAARRGVRAQLGVQLGVAAITGDVIGGSSSGKAANVTPYVGVFGGASFALGARFELRVVAELGYAFGGTADCYGYEINNCFADWSSVLAGADVSVRVRPVSISSAWYVGLGIKAAAVVVFASEEYDRSTGYSPPVVTHETGSADLTTPLAGAVLETGASFGANEEWDVGVHIEAGVAGEETDQEYFGFTLLGGRAF